MRENKETITNMVGVERKRGNKIQREEKGDVRSANMWGRHYASKIEKKNETKPYQRVA